MSRSSQTSERGIVNVDSGSGDSNDLIKHQPRIDPRIELFYWDWFEGVVYAPRKEALRLLADTTMRVYAHKWGGVKWVKDFRFEVLAETTRGCVVAEPGDPLRTWVSKITVTGKNEKATTFTGYMGGVKSLKFSSDGIFLFVETNDGIHIWNTHTGSRVEGGSLPEVFQKTWRSVRPQLGAPFSIVFSPDGTKILARCLNFSAKLYDASTGLELKTFSGHTDEITSVAFSPDGTRILTGSRDCTARLWDVETGEELRVFTAHRLSVTSVAFSPDGTKAVTGGDDGAAHLWPLDRSEEEV